MEEIIRSMANQFGFDRPVVIDKYDYVEIQVLRLPKELQEQGIGTKFMREVFREADRRGVVLGVFADPPMLGWYERLGFITDHDKERYPVTCIRMPEGVSESDGG